MKRKFIALVLITMVVLTAFGVVLETAPKTAAEPGTTVSMTTDPLSYSGTVANGATVNIPLTVPPTNVTLSATEEGTWTLSTPGGSSTDTGRSFEFSANLVGDYSVTFSSLQREVGSGWSATIVVALPSQSQPPVANAGPDQTAAINTKVTLNGTASYDPDNNLPLTYAWSIQSAPATSLVTTQSLSDATASQPTFTTDVAGQYVFALNVTDSLGVQSATFATVTITATNTAPTLTAFTVTPATVAINTPVTATATFADPDAGQSHTVTFDWGDGSTPSTVNVAAGVMQASATHAYVAASTYTVTCTVADNGNPPLTATPQTAVITAYMPQLTDLQIGATPNPARVGQPVTVRATVDNPSGVSGTLAYSWSLVTPSGSAVPTPSGGQTTGTGPFTLTFTFTPDIAGQYNAQVQVQWGTLPPLKSAPVSVTVNKTSTQLSATATPTVVAITKPFMIAGTLSTTDGTPIAGATIQLQKNVSGNWQAVSGKTCTTATTGAYSISTSEPLANTYQYRSTCTGSDTYAGITSNSVSVKVVSKASVLQDLATLRTTINQLPNSAFIPGTKTVLLAELSVTELEVKLNVYGRAATTLQQAVLPRMDGWAKTGNPDGNDWVRTATAQAQLFPQVQNLIQELQALHGS